MSKQNVNADNKVTAPKSNASEKIIKALEKLFPDVRVADVKRFLIMNVPFAIIWYIADKISWLYRHIGADTVGARIGNTFINLMCAFDSRLPSFHIIDVLIGIAVVIILKLVLKYRSENAKKFRHGVEYGSARGGNAKDIAPYITRQSHELLLFPIRSTVILNELYKIAFYCIKISKG